MSEELKITVEDITEKTGLSPDKWVKMEPGVQITSVFGETEQWNPTIGEENKMTYGSYNGVLAAVDAEGRMQVAPYTSDRMNALQEAGYRFGGLWVPMSNGEQLTDPTLQAQWEKMRTEASAQNLQERIEGDLRLYQSRAEERGIKSEVAGEWLVLEGAETKHFMGETSVIEKSVGSYNMPMGRLDQVGTYQTNNGIVAFVNERGQMCVAPMTTERMRALNEAGYTTRGSIWVPMSNGEQLTDPTLQAQWEKMRTEASAQNLQERIEGDLRLYQSRAEERGIKSEVAGEWLVLEGAETKHFMGETSVIEKSVGSYNMPMGRLDQVGTYQTNNGIVAFVNERGQMCVAPMTTERMRALNEAGYTTRGSIWVPMSNGEQLTDPTLQAQWEKMRTEARAER